MNTCHIALVSLADGMYGLGVPSKSYNIMAAGKAILFIGNLEIEIALTIQEYCFESKDTSGLKTFLRNLFSDTIPTLEEMGKRARILAENKYAKIVVLDKFLKTL